MTIDTGRVGMIGTDLVSIEDRARKKMGDLDSLEQNMRESGLISPLAVKENKDGTFRLLAGERRYTVLKRNGITEIPVRIYDRDLTPLEIKVIEKAENFHRKDFEYWELDSLTLEIHRMQQELYGVKAPGPGQEGWDMTDTADMLGGVSKATVSMSVKRAEAREAFPELFQNCKTASDASKVMKKVSDTLTKQAIVKRLEENRPSGTLEQLGKAFIIKDFFKGVKSIPDGIMNLVEIDPPYGIDLNRKKKAEGESQYMQGDYNEIDVQDYQVFLANTFSECYRVMADHSWLICWFAPQPWFEVVYQELNNAGFRTTRMCGLWVKNGAGQNMQPQVRLSNNYEMFFYAWKGQPVLNKAGRSNVFNYPSVPPMQKIHPTERPLDMMKDLYSTFCFGGSRVLIPFLGSGVGLLAAHELNMAPVGFELSKGYRDSFLVKLHGMKVS